MRRRGEVAGLLGVVPVGHTHVARLEGKAGECIERLGSLAPGRRAQGHLQRPLRQLARDVALATQIMKHREAAQGLAADRDIGFRTVLESGRVVIQRDLDPSRPAPPAGRWTGGRARFDRHDQYAIA